MTDGRGSRVRYSHAGVLVVVVLDLETRAPRAGCFVRRSGIHLVGRRSPLKFARTSFPVWEAAPSADLATPHRRTEPPLQKAPRKTRISSQRPGFRASHFRNSIS